MYDDLFVQENLDNVLKIKLEKMKDNNWLINQRKTVNLQATWACKDKILGRGKQSNDINEKKKGSQVIHGLSRRCNHMQWHLVFKQ